MLKIEKVFAGLKINSDAVDALQSIKEVLSYKIAKTDNLKDLCNIIRNLDDDGSVNELIDGDIDIYNYNLRVWAVENYDYIDDATEEFGAADDFHASIMQGQYCYYNEIYNEILIEMVDYIESKYNV